tara:strand:+ start:1820 stop:1987 length:168 start_codon:yes stop_codon:yes gene_type:complete
MKKEGKHHIKKIHKLGEVELTQEEWFNALRTPGPVRNKKKFKRKPKHPKKDLGED